MSALVVSLHDVSPLTREAFTVMLRELAGVGVTKTSLLVIPDHHHRGHMSADLSFCRWLEELAQAGHELVVHGYHHQRDIRGDENARARWINTVYTNGEGEFYDLPEADAAALLARAGEAFAQLDAPAPKGFIAPAWLLGSEADAAVRDAGFHYTTLLTGVRTYPRSGNPADFLRSQSLVYSCRNGWRRACSRLWNAALRRRLRHNPLVRLGLHPPDREHPAIWEQILRFARAEVEARATVTYGEFVASHPLPA